MKLWMGFFDMKGEEFCRRVETRVENEMFVASPDIPASCKLFVHKVGLSTTPDSPVLIEATVERTLTGADRISVGGSDERLPWLREFVQAEDIPAVRDEKPIDDDQITAAVEVLKEWKERL